MKSQDKGLLLSKFIVPGSKIELEAIERLLQKDGTYKRKKFDSKVVEVIDEEHLEILMPMEQTKLVLLPVNGEYEVHFFTDKGLFQCLVRVVDRYKNGNIFLLSIEMISNLQRYQRREYYRYSCLMDMRIRECSPNENFAIKREADFAPEFLPTVQATIVDISGGGIRFTMNSPLERDSYVVVYFTLSMGGRTKEYEVVSKILACKEMENKRGYYEHRIQFMKITNSEREEIIRYIFEEERKKRKREN